MSWRGTGDIVLFIVTVAGTIPEQVGA